VAAGGVQHDVPGGGAVPAAPLRGPAGAGTGAAPAEIINVRGAGAPGMQASQGGIIPGMPGGSIAREAAAHAEGEAEGAAEEADRERGLTPGMGMGMGGPMYGRPAGYGGYGGGPAMRGPQMGMGPGATGEGEAGEYYAGGGGGGVIPGSMMGEGMGGGGYGGYRW